jgi:nitronate monooxygenase
MPASSRRSRSWPGTRQWFDGPIALSGAIANGRAILAAGLGADFAYIGSAFIATQEANAVEGYKQMITSSPRRHRLFQSVHRRARQLSAPSIVAAGMDPDNLPESDASKMSFGTDASGERAKPKAWKEIWGSGQGVGSIGKIMPAAERAVIARFKKEYDEAVDPGCCPAAPNATRSDRMTSSRWRRPGARCGLNSFPRK